MDLNTTVSSVAINRRKRQAVVDCVATFGLLGGMFLALLCRMDSCDMQDLFY
jgi:hypothetical protein